jgi:hypothetical protein
VQPSKTLPQVSQPPSPSGYSLLLMLQQTSPEFSNPLRMSQAAHATTPSLS